MSQDYKLFRELSNKKEDNNQPVVVNTPTIKYQEYELTVENKQQTVLIPLRECENFENTLSEYEFINKLQLRKILYKHRGMRKK